MQFANYKIKMILMAVIICAGLLLAKNVFSATYWVNDPNNCPNVYDGVNCASEIVCGINGVACFNPASLLPPSSPANSVTQYTGSFGAGYILNCLADRDSASPYCDNSSAMWCNASTTCTSYNRFTTCAADKWAGDSGAASCGNCRSGYHDCNADGLTCEIHDGDACITGGGLPGHYLGCSGLVGNCVAEPQHFITGINAEFSTSSPLLWGTQHGDGDLVSIAKNGVSTSTFMVSNSGQVGIGLTAVTNPYVALEVSSTERGVLLPRLSETQKIAMPTSSLPSGLLIYNTDYHQFEYYATSSWLAMGAGGGSFSEIDPIWSSASGSLTVSHFATNTVSQWNNDAGYVTSGYQFAELNFTNATGTNLYITNNFTALGNSYFGIIASGTWQGDVIDTAYGGTGTSTLGPAGSVAYSNGASYAFTTVGANGELLISNGSGAPSWVSSTTIASASGWTDDGTVVRLTTITDNVGIGTTTPQNKLTVLAGSYDGIVLYNTSSQLLAGLGVSPTGVHGGLGLYEGGNLTPRVFIASAGTSYINNPYHNFGIGTTSPSYKLTVAGDFHVTGTIRVGDSADSGTLGQLFMSNGFDAPSWVSTSSLGISVNPAGNDGEIQFNNSGAFGATPTLYWDKTNEYLGIGTNAPSTILTVVGTSTMHNIIPASHLAYDLGASSSRWNNVWAYNYNIGSSTWSMRVDPVKDYFLLYDGPDGTGNQVMLANTNPFGPIIQFGEASSPLSHNYYLPDNNGVLSLTNTNNDIAGEWLSYYGGPSDWYSSFLLHDSITANSVYLTASTTNTSFILSKLGIGTNTSNYPLSVSGDFNFTGALRVNGNSGTAGQLLQSNGSGAPSWVATSSLGLGTGNLSGSGTSTQVAFFTGSDTLSSSSSLYWDNINGRLGINNPNPEFALTLGTDGGIIATGTFNSGITLSTAGAGTRMIWYPRKAAFRAGRVTGTRWNEAEIGSYSVAFGYDTYATGTYSNAFGRFTTAGANYATAFGWNSNATGQLATVFGYNNTASGEGSFSAGEGNNASGRRSVAFGWYNYPAGDNSLSIGSYTRTGGSETIAFGYGAVADGYYGAGAFGYYSTSSGYTSFAFGRKMTVTGDYSFGINVANDTPYTLSQPSTIALMGGNVGIGTTTPTDKLVVDGSIDVTAGNYYKYNGMNFAMASTTLFNYFSGGAGNLTMTGFNNSAFGNSALQNNTSGYFNTAIGDGSLQYNNTGNLNTAIGKSALILNSSGSFNVAMGVYALSFNSTGSENTAIGQNALQANTSGIGNTAIGYYAGYGDEYTENMQSNIDTYSTFIGNRASRDSSVPTSTPLTNATAIGYNAKVGASNSLILGGTGSDAVRVAIGTSTPLTTFTLRAISNADGMALVNNEDFVTGSWLSYKTVDNGDRIYSNFSLFQHYSGSTTEAVRFSGRTDNEPGSKSWIMSSLGIGTTTPSDKLHVQGLSDGTGITVSSQNNYTVAKLLHADTDIGQLSLYNGGVETVRLVGKGLSYINTTLGIGTTTPAYKLTVIGDFYVTGTIRVGNTASAGTAGQLLMSNGSSAPSWVSTSTLGLVDGEGSPSFVSFWNSSSTLSYDGDGMFWDGFDNRLGVGTTTPQKTLSIISPNNNGIALYQSATMTVGISHSGYSGNIQLFSNSTTPSAQITSNGLSYFNGGNVGIGTSTPGATLSVVTPGNNGIVLYGSTNGYTLGALASGAGNETGGLVLYTNNYAYPTVSITGGVSGANTFSYFGTSTYRFGIATSSPLTGFTFVVAGTSSLRNVLPETNLIYSLGDSSKRWNELWVSTANIGTSTWSLTASTSNGRLGFFDSASGGGNERMTILTGGNVGIGTTTPSVKLHIDNDGGILARGIAGSGQTFPSVSSADNSSYFIWNPRKAALRAGFQALTYWDETNIGTSSVAFGISQASGIGAVAFHGNNIASGNYSFAGGFFSSSTASESFAFGNQVLAGSIQSVAFGALNQATGNQSAVFGYNNKVSGVQGVAFGATNTVAGIRGVAFGSSSTIDASSIDSATFGYQNIIGGVRSFAFGSLNTIYGTATDSVAFGFANAIGAVRGFAFGDENNVTFAATGSMAFGRYLTIQKPYVFGVNVGSGGPYNLNQGNSIIFMGGNVGIGTTTPSHLLDMEGGGYYRKSDGNWVSVSSKNFKQDIVPITEYQRTELLGMLDNLEINRFRFINDYNEYGDDAIWNYGFIAEDTNELLSGHEHDGLSLGSSVQFLLTNLQTIYRAFNPIDFSLDATTSTLSFNLPTLSFTTTTIFESSVSSTPDSRAFIFNALNFNTSDSDKYILSLRSNNNPTFSVSANGDVHALGNMYAASAILGTSTNPGDLAERVDINPNETVEAGDVMMVDPASPDRYQKSNQAYEPTVAGVISTNPTIIVGNGKTQQTAPLAMVGRVPVKYSEENGPIQRGDLLVSANTPGYAMKYNPETDNSRKIVGIIGIALDSSDNSTNGKVMALIRTGWVYNKTQAVSNLEQQVYYVASSVGIDFSTNPEELNINSTGSTLTYDSNNNLNLSNHSIINIKSIISTNNKWTIDENGLLITKVATSEGDKNIYGMTSESAEITLSGSDQLINGEITITFATSTRELIDENEVMKVIPALTSGDCNGIYVSAKSTEGFIIKELNNGTSNATFDWVVIAKRKIINTQAPIPEQPTTSSFEDPVVDNSSPSSTPETEEDASGVEDETKQTVGEEDSEDEDSETDPDPDPNDNSG
jgi:hypothetical protein